MSAAIQRAEPRERPILFSAPMIRALLAGTKTQTRRVARFAAFDGANLAFSGLSPGHFNTGTPATGHVLYARGAGGVWQQRTKPLHCPYGEPGSTLWVRETHRIDFLAGFRETPKHAHVHYRASAHPSIGDMITAKRGWRPSIFMPRWASRIDLEVTEVRVQRLAEIAEDDARAEGVEPCDGTSERCVFAVLGGCGARVTDKRHLCAFAQLWQAINGERPGCAWADSPWVWCVSFKRVRP